MSTEPPQDPFLARTIRRLSVPIILAWVALTLIVTLAVPSLEHVGQKHSVPLAPPDAPAAGAQSPDRKAAYVQVNLAGNQGTTLGQESVAAVRDIVQRTPPPPGVKVYVTGPSALVADTQHSGDRSILKMTVIG